MKNRERLKGTLFDKKRFEWLEKSRVKELQNMSQKETIRRQKDILLFSEVFRGNYSSDNTVNYEILMKTNK